MNYESDKEESEKEETLKPKDDDNVSTIEDSQPT